MAITTPQGFDLQAAEPLELKTVKDLFTDMEDISLVTRYEGLKVYVQETQANYQLRGGITNTHWVIDNLDTSLYYTKVNLQTDGEAEVHWNNLTNVPAVFTPSAHTHTESEITDLQSYLLNINSESIGDLADVTLTSPEDGQQLHFEGGTLVNFAPGTTNVVWGNIVGDIGIQYDLQSLLAGKEPIFSKNTAFNVNFGTTAGTATEGNHTHYEILVPQSSAVATSSGLELNNTKYNNYIPQAIPIAHTEGTIYYDDSDKTFMAYNDISDVTLAIGEELWGRVTNTNAYTLGNGQAGYVRSSSGINLDCDLADASDLDQSTRVLGLFTNDIAPGQDGYIVRFGVIHDMDTSTWSVGDALFLDAHNPGGLTNVRPVAPHYPVRIGLVMLSDPSNGAVAVDTLAFNGTDTSASTDGIIDGIVIYTPQINITVDTGIIYADVTREDSPSHDLPFLINGVRYALNTTTNTGPGGAARIVIPPGLSDTEIQSSRLFIKLNAGVPELAITTSGIYEPYAHLASFAVFNATRTLADGKPLMYRRSNNAMSSEDVGIDGSFGLVTVLADAIRFKLGSNWLFGQDATTTINDTTIRLATTSGLAAQLHLTSTPLFDGTAYLLYNTVANVVTYEHSTNLIDIVTDAEGNSLLTNNTFYTIRLFYQLNSDGVGNSVIATRPLGSYTTSAEAIQDASNYTTNVTDTAIEETIYPIYDLVIGRTGAGGGTIALEFLRDLRTKLSKGGGGGGGTTGGGTDDKVRISASDIINDYLGTKIVAGDGILIETLNSGANETLEINAGPTTVGTGGQYATVQLALADSKYNLKLISTVTETVTWGTHTKDIIITADELTILNISVANTSDIVVRATNINFNVSGTAALFTSTSKLYLNSCRIVGDTAANNVRGGFYGNDIHIELGTNGFIIFLHDVIGLTINGDSATGGEAVAVAIFGTVINTTMTGAFLLGVDLHDGVMQGVYGDGQSGIRIRGTVGSVLDNAIDVSLYIRTDTESTLTNCELWQFHMYTSTYSPFKLVDNCIINEILAPNTGGNTDTLYGFKDVTNTSFTDADIHIIDDDTTLQNCSVTLGTIIVDATTNKTTIIGCRTSTAITDNGVETTLLANNLI